MENYEAGVDWKQAFSISCFVRSGKHGEEGEKWTEDA